jgi:protein-tyrosine-phosphatase
MIVFPSPRLAVRFAKRVADRLRHKSRRRAATDMLREGAFPRSILVVCQGNVCRSPYAAAVLRRRCDSISLGIRIDSAGFVGPNRAPPAGALTAAAERGADISAHRSRMVQRDILDSADLIVVMDAGQAKAVTARYSPTSRRVLVLGDLDPDSISTREIIDPFGQERAVFDACYDRIDRCATELVRLLAASGGEKKGR